MGFIVFSSGFLKRVIFLVGSNYIKTEDTYERLIYFRR